MSNPLQRLPTLLAIDATTCAAMGGLLLAAPDAIAGLTDLSPLLLRGTGVALLPIAGFIAAASRLRPVPGWAAGFVVLGNLAWVLASIALPLFGLVKPNALGLAFLLAQATAVAILAGLERKAARTTAAALARALP